MQQLRLFSDISGLTPSEEHEEESHSPASAEVWKHQNRAESYSEVSSLKNAASDCKKSSFVFKTTAYCSSVLVMHNNTSYTVQAVDCGGGGGY